MARWLITGASGLFGRHLCAVQAAAGRDVHGISLSHCIGLDGVEEHRLDIADAGALAAAARGIAPDVIVHCAGLTSIEACETREDEAIRLHRDATAALARLAADRNLPFVYISTDHLWRGDQAFVTEETSPAPVNAYARTKLLGEAASLEANPQALILRTNFVGHGQPWQRSFIDWIDGALAKGEPLTGFANVFFTPIAVPHLCSVLETLVARRAAGLFHVAGSERISKYDFMVRFAESAGYDAGLVARGALTPSLGMVTRPLDMSLSTAKISALLGRAMPDLAECLAALPPEDGGRSACFQT